MKLRSILNFVRRLGALLVLPLNAFRGRKADPVLTRVVLSNEATVKKLPRRPTAIPK